MANRTELAKKCGLIGAGAALGLYAFFGLMQGAAIGGAAGLAIANYVFGSGTLALMANELLPRIIVAAAMLTGVLVSCVAFVMTGGTAGAVAGLMLGMVVGTSADSHMVPEAVLEKE